MPRLIAPSLSYPTGATPGFDPSHPAVGDQVRIGYTASVIALSGTVVNLMNGKAAAPTGSAAKSFGGIGPVTSYTGATDVSTLSGFVGTAIVSNAAMTMAAIGYITSITSGASTFIVNQTGSSMSLGALSAGGDLVMTVNGTSIDSGISFPLSAPVFCVGSTQINGGTNFVLVNLATGSIKTAAGAGSSAISAGDGNYYFGNRNGIRVLNGGMAAAMVSVSPSQLSIPQLVQWAADPWSFWYL